MAEPGWYRDKRDPTILRKWDGGRWTGETADFAPPPPAPEPEIVEPIDWGPEPDPPTPWWRSRWALAIGVVGAVAVIGLATRGGGDDHTGASSTTDGPVDTRPRQAATTLALTGTPEGARAAFASIFENGKTPLASILGDDRNVKTLDRFDYDAAAGIVTLGITSVWTSTVDQTTGAWELTRAVAELYKPDRGRWWQEAFVPTFRLINSGQSRTCTGALMVQLTEGTADRTAWEASC
jgi:hypothetical protein